MTDKTPLLDKEFLTVEEVADVLRVHWQTVLEYIRSGQLEANKVGKSYLVSSQTLQVFLRERTTGLSLPTLKERIGDLLTDKALKDKRGIVLSAGFLPPVTIKTLFTSGEQSYAELMRNPPTTRQMGWSFRTSQNDPQPILGKYLEVRGGDAFRVRLYKDGHLLAYGSGEAEFLSWGVNKDATGSQAKGDNINGLAIAEFIYNYSSLVIEVIKRLGQPVKMIDLYLHIHNPHATKIKNVMSQANWAFPLADYGTAVAEKEVLLGTSLDYNKAMSTDAMAAVIWKEYSHVFGLLDDQIAYLNPEKDAFDRSVFKEQL